MGRTYLGQEFGGKGVKSGVEEAFLIRTLALAVKSKWDLNPEDDATLSQIGARGNWGYVKKIKGDDFVGEKAGAVGSANKNHSMAFRKT
ncbi:MAG: hypothetical protein V1721_07840 [Pseudomonadota bacterium]